MSVIAVLLWSPATDGACKICCNILFDDGDDDKEDGADDTSSSPSEKKEATTTTSRRQFRIQDGIDHLHLGATAGVANELAGMRFAII